MMEGLLPRLCCGCSASSEVQYVAPHTILLGCGSGLLLLHVQSGQQRVLGSSAWQGIQCFASSVKGGVLAVALKGYQPAVNIFSTHDLQQQASLAAGSSLGYTAVAVSHDGELLAVCADSPDLELSVWHWRKGLKLASAKLHAPVSKISFHPADNSVLLTTSAQPAAAIAGDAAACSSLEANTAHASACQLAGQAASSSPVLLWQLHKLWERHELQSTPLQLPSVCQPTCHAWAPEGVYLGCSDGCVFCMSPETGAVISKASAQVIAAAAGSRSSADNPAQSSDASASVSSIAVNKQWLVVACSNAPHLSFYQRWAGEQQSDELQPLGSMQVSSVGCSGVAFGGPGHAHLVVSTVDGSLLLLLSPGSQFEPGQPDPASLQVEPLADWHVGAITGVAATATGAHLVSCGLDGSIRVWAAATGGQLVSKRDVGGQLTCSVACMGPDSSLLAVGSKVGVLRLVNIGDLGSLPVVHHSRLFRASVTHVGFSACGTYLAAAAASTDRVALLKVTGAGQQVQLLGYVKAEGAITSLCWLPHAGQQQPQLAAGLASGKLLLLTPPLRPAHINPADLAATTPSNSAESGAASWVLDLALADVHAVTLSVPTSLQAMAALAQDMGSSTHSRAGSTAGANSNSSAQVLAASCDGQLFWLQLPADVGKVPHSRLAGQQAAVVVAKAALPWPAAALSVSPSGREVLLAGVCGAVLRLPTAPDAAAAVLTAAESAAVTGLTGATGADAASPAAALAWSADAAWAASAGSDGSLLVYATGAEGALSGAAAAALPAPALSLPDCDAADDPQLPTVPEAEAARAEHEAWAAAESVRAATMRQLEDLKRRSEQALEANAAAPADQQLSEAELVLNSQLLQQQRSSVAAEEAQLLSEAPRKSREQEVQAKRLKALCWDAFQVKRAVCTGLRSADPQVWNFQLPAQDDAEWSQVAEQRREQLLAANKHILEQDSYTRSAASSTAAGTAPAASSASGTNGSADGGSGNRTSDPGIPATNSTASMSTVTDGVGGSSQQAIEHLALLTRVKACSDARKCSPADLLLPELGVTSPENKLAQAVVYKRMMWELTTQFNKGFDELVKQKHTDADRLSDLNTRVDELIRELVKIHLVLNPTVAAPAAANDAVAGADSAGRSSMAGVSAGSVGDGSAARESGNGGAAEGSADVQSAMQLTAELGHGRLVPFWSPEENLEDMLLKIQPGEIKSAKYLTPAERAKADAEEAAAEAARRAASADSSRARALQQMMGGRLARSVDEVSELVTSRPAWMVSGDPSTFNEEQLKEYKEYTAKEQAAIEERLKRKGIMETELRTLRAAAEEVASKFDAAVAALAAKRLDVLAEVTALETRVLQLQADEEMATVTAGPEAQAAAAHKLQQVQAALAAVDRELAVTQHLHDQQQEALAALHAEEKARDRAFKRDFSLVDPLVLPHLTTLYKNRIIPLDQAGVLEQHSTAAISHAQGERACSARRGSVSASPRHARGGQTSASPRASKMGAVGHLESPRLGAAATAGQDAGSTSAELSFMPLNLPVGRGLGSAVAVASAQPTAGSGSGAHARGSSTGMGQHDVCGPLGPPEVAVVQIYDDQMPEGLDEMLWQRFVELHASRAQLDLAVREQTAKVLCLKRRLQLLLQHHAEASEQVAAAAGVLEGLQRQHHRALYDVEVQLKLKQGQIEVWPTGVSSIAPEALLVDRGEVKGLNKIILSKGAAKLDMLRKMKAFKRGIHQLEWENKKCQMAAEDVTSLTQQLQLLHVTKEFQQQVKAGASSSSTGSSGTGRPGSNPAGTSGLPPGGAGAAGSGAAPPGSSAAASKEVASLEKLLKVRETLHANAVEQKKRQLRSVEAQLAAKRNENATLALHLAGLERLLDEAARLRSSTAADDALSAADRKARSLAMQAKLRDIADAQAAEIAAAERELHAWQQRCFPCLPALPGEDDEQPSGGADQAPSSSRGAGAGSCTLPEIKGAAQPGGVYSGAAGELRQSGGGFAPHGARASRGHGGLPGSPGSSSGGMFGVQKGGKKYVGPDGKPELLRRG